MDSTPLPPPYGEPRGKSPKALWAVIGALAVAVLALGGVLLNRQGQGSNAPPPVVASTAPPQAPDDFKSDPPPALPAVPPPAGNAPAQTATTPSASPAPALAPQVARAGAVQAGPGPGMSQPVRAAPAPCAVCGHVESVRQVQRSQPASGVGAVAGGVVGGLLGNQFGHGNGRAATTVLGAVGGGFAGNAVEKHVRRVTVYQVSVRMDNGKLRTIETKTAPPIGKAVTLKAGVLRPANGRS
jgi:outer membrane lipoprotein SlyB